MQWDPVACWAGLPLLCGLGSVTAYITCCSKPTPPAVTSFYLTLWKEPKEGHLDHRALGTQCPGLKARGHIVLGTQRATWYSAGSEKGETEKSAGSQAETPTWENWGCSHFVHVRPQIWLGCPQASHTSSPSSAVYPGAGSCAERGWLAARVRKRAVPAAQHSLLSYWDRTPPPSEVGVYKLLPQRRQPFLLGWAHPTAAPHASFWVQALQFSLKKVIKRNAYWIKTKIHPRKLSELYINSLPFMVLWRYAFLFDKIYPFKSIFI